MKASEDSKKSMYKTIWRWHFYAGILIAPFLVVLAITGSIYLFKPQIEQSLYDEYYTVEAQGEKVTAAQQIEAVEDKYPNTLTTKFRPGESGTRSSEVWISTDEGTKTVFVNPYDSSIIGELDANNRIMDKIEELHGELMAGTVGDRIVELVSCWAIVLLVTGLFLWFPRKKKKTLGGTIIPRFHKGKYTLRRDLHAVPGFWIAGGMFFLIMTGLPWSGFWGTNFQILATNSGDGYPPSVWVGNAPASDVKTKEIADVPWAAENLDVPLSNVNGLISVSVDEVIETADREGLYPGYTIIIPSTPNGVYTISSFPPKAQDEVTMHIDQYSGAVLADYRYDNYGWLGKAIALGITLHKGTQFGIVNQLISALICLGIVLLVVSGFYLWLKRKPKREMGAPKAPSIRTMEAFLIIMIALGIIFPLVGVSLIVIWLVDVLLIRNIPTLKAFLNA